MIKNPILILLFLWLATFPGYAQNDLTFYLETAFSYSPVIYQNQQLIKISRVEVSRLRSEHLKPNVSLSADYVLAPYFHNQGHFLDVSPADQAIGYDAGITNGGLYAGLLKLKQPLFANPVFQVYRKGQQVQESVYQYTLSREKHDLQKKVTDQYITVYQDQEQIRVSEDILKLLARQQQIVEALAKAGILKKSDLILIGIDVKDQQASLNDARAGYYRDLMDLNILCGLSDTAAVVLMKPQIELHEQEAGLSQFRNRYLADSMKLMADQQIADVTYRPQVNLFADTGLNAVELSGIGRKFGFSAGISFSLTLYDGKQKALNHQKNQLAVDTVSFSRHYFMEQVALNQHKFRHDLDASAETIRLLQTQLADYKNLIQEYQAQLQVGGISVIDYINGVKYYTQLQSNLVTAESKRLNLINAYNYWNW